MNRRGFLTRSGLALGALIVGEEVLEEIARLTHVRKSFPSAGVPLTELQKLDNFMASMREEFSSTIYYGNTEMFEREFSGLTLNLRDWRVTQRLTVIA